MSKEALQANKKIGVTIVQDGKKFTVIAKRKKVEIEVSSTPSIQREMNRIVGIDCDKFTKDKNTPEVKYIQYNLDNPDDERNLLESEIKAILAGGIKNRDITILSAFKKDNSVVSKVTKYKIDDVGDETDNITYSTIQGFKGLENSVIILTDVQTYNKPDLMYVAMSRARSALYIFETKYAEKYRKGLSR